MTRLLVLPAFVVASLIFAETPTNPRPPVALYSWKPPGQPWHFALIHDPARSMNKTEISRIAAPVVGIPALKSRLASMPRTASAIIWRNDPPEHTLLFPPAAIRDEIIAFGKHRGLNIEVWPTLHE